MGKIGKRLIEIPEKVEARIQDGIIEVKGPKGVLKQEVRPVIKLEIKDKKIATLCESRDPKALALQGLYNSLVENMITGVTEGFIRRLEMVGVGYRAIKQGKDLQLQLGFSHPIIFVTPAGIDIKVEGTNKIVIEGIDRQLVGEVAAKIRRFRKVEPYKGKGIRYEGEVVRRKAGKAAKTAGGAA